MITPLTRVLLRIFAAGFYKMHAGMLLGTFLGGVMYLFFIGVLNQTHLLPQDIILFRLIFVLTLINSPLIAGLVAIAWVMYMLKSWKYIAAQIGLPQNQFLRYGSTAIDLNRQRISWAAIQSIIMLPPLIFGLFAWVNGIIFKYPLTIPTALLLFTILLIIISAYRHTYLLNRLTHVTNSYWLARVTRVLPKPYFSLSIYHWIHHEKLTLIITKAASAALLIIGTYLFQEDSNDIRSACLIVLGVPVIHAILLYRAYRFENRYLSFIRNFPYSKLKRYLALVIEYCIITLPESIWIITFNLKTAPLLLLINISLGTALRCTTYRTGFSMQRFITQTFLLLIVTYISILFKAQWLTIGGCALLSLITFYRHYDLQDQHPAGS